MNLKQWVLISILATLLSGCFGDSKEETQAKDMFLSYKFLPGSENPTMGQMLSKKLGFDEDELKKHIKVSDINGGRKEEKIWSASFSVDGKQEWRLVNIYYLYVQPWSKDAKELFKESYKVDAIDEPRTLGSVSAETAKELLEKEFPGQFSEGDVRRGARDEASFNIRSNSGKYVNNPINGNSIFVPDILLEFQDSHFTIHARSDTESKKLMKITKIALATKSTEFPWGVWLDQLFDKALFAVSEKEKNPNGQCKSIETGCKAKIEFSPLSWWAPLHFRNEKSGLWISTKDQ